MKPIILAVEYDGELGIFAFDRLQQALHHLRLELTGWFDDSTHVPEFDTTDEVWDFINEHGVFLNFRVLDLRESDRSLY